MLRDLGAILLSLLVLLRFGLKNRSVLHELLVPSGVILLQLRHSGRIVEMRGEVRIPSVELGRNRLNSLSLSLFSYPQFPLGLRQGRKPRRSLRLLRLVRPLQLDRSTLLLDSSTLVRKRIRRWLAGGGLLLTGGILAGIGSSRIAQAFSVS